MQIIPLASVQPNTVPQGAVILFGCFDGVHLGHLALLDEAKRLAGDTHPIAVWVIDRGVPEVLTTPEEKRRIFAENGAHYLITEDFGCIRSLSGDEFFRQHVLSFRPSAVVCGFNFRFGAKASCGADTLAEMAETHGIHCSVVPAMTVNGSAVSSTAVRNAVHEGNLPLASAMLGRPLSYTSEILHGKQLGRTISHPTVNQRIPAGKIAPPRGVYSCIVTFEKDGQTVTKGGVCNIGSRPTVNDDEGDVTLETFLFDFSGDLYGITLTASLMEMLRPERRFESVDALRQQIEKDEEAARLSLMKRRTDPNL